MNGKPHPHCDVCHHKRGRGATHKGYINSPSIQMADWVPKGRHIHTDTHEQIRQVWERPLALILLETACWSTSYHIPAEQYTTLGSKCSFLMLKCLYVFELYSLSASWTPGICVNIRGCIDSFSSARVDILGLWRLILDHMSSVEFVQ